MPIHTTVIQRRLLIAGCVSAFLVFLVGLLFTHRTRPTKSFRPAPNAESPLLPTRPEPDRFPPNTHLPRVLESAASGPVDLASFSPGRSLTYIDDKQAWWESDHDTNDIEDDHTIHTAMREPLQRLIEMVSEHGATLKIHDTFRSCGIHGLRSLHKEGRAVDVTCDELGLEKLAKLCWAAGFDWVYYEAKRRKGAHIHCSVGRNRPDGRSN